MHPIQVCAVARNALKCSIPTDESQGHVLTWRACDYPLYPMEKGCQALYIYSGAKTPFYFNMSPNFQNHLSILVGLKQSMAADLAQDTSLGDKCAYLLLTLVKHFWLGVCCAILFDIIQSGHTVLYVLMMTENNANH